MKCQATIQWDIDDNLSAVLACDLSAGHTSLHCTTITQTRTRPDAYIETVTTIKWVKDP